MRTYITNMFTLQIYKYVYCLRSQRCVLAVFFLTIRHLNLVFDDFSLNFRLLALRCMNEWSYSFPSLLIESCVIVAWSVYSASLCVVVSHTSFYMLTRLDTNLFTARVRVRDFVHRSVYEKTVQFNHLNHSLGKHLTNIKQCVLDFLCHR